MCKACCKKDEAAAIEIAAVAFSRSQFLIHASDCAGDGVVVGAIDDMEAARTQRRLEGLGFTTYVTKASLHGLFGLQEVEIG